MQTILQLLTAIAAIGAGITALAARNAVYHLTIKMNSRLDLLLTTTAKAAHAEGLATGRAEQKEPIP